jgi:hypothetical protein
LTAHEGQKGKSINIAAFWAEMGVAYLEINKLHFLNEIDIPKCINV